MNFIIKEGNIIEFTYTNYKGETKKRKALVSHLYFGSTPYHPERQMMIYALDLDKMQYRTFATKDILDIHTVFVPTV